jgi:adenylate kinase
MAGIPDLFVGFGVPAKTKFLILGSPDFSSEKLMNWACSLHIEHVSPARLKGPEISRRPASAAVQEVTMLAHMRRWFFARKPDAGFVLTDFPATLLQAKVFDEWLDARDEALSAVVVGQGAPKGVIEHYHTLGLLMEPGDLPFAATADGFSTSRVKVETR